MDLAGRRTDHLLEISRKTLCGNLIYQSFPAYSPLQGVHCNIFVQCIQPNLLLYTREIIMTFGSFSPHASLRPKTQETRFQVRKLNSPVKFSAFSARPYLHAPIADMTIDDNHDMIYNHAFNTFSRYDGSSRPCWVVNIVLIYMLN